MKLKKYAKTALLSSILAFGLSVSTLETGALDGSAIKVYAKKKTVKSDKKKVKKDKKVLKNFKAVVEGESDAGTAFYTDSKNNKIYISVEDFFSNLKGTVKEAKISVSTKKKSVKVNLGKKYKYKSNYINLPKSIYGKPENIELDIDGNKTEVKGYVVKSDSYWSKGEDLYADFDELAEKFGLVYDKDIAKKKYLLYTKLPENVVELKSDKPMLDSFDPDNGYSYRFDNEYDSINESWVYPTLSYLYEENGKLIRVEAIEGDKKIVSIKSYDENGNFIDSKELLWQGNVFGGFYRGAENNYLIFGNDNEEEDDNKEVVKIVKLDRSFNEVGTLSVKGAYTVHPFYYGSLRCAEIGNKILVHTVRLRYDGHQSQLTIGFDEDSMSLMNADDLDKFQKNHISHDLNQYVMADGNEFITVDHGDAYPRSILVSWLSLENLKPLKKQEIFNIPGAIGANETGIFLGGVTYTNNKILAAVNKIDYSKAISFSKTEIEGVDVDKRDIVLYSLDKYSMEIHENKYTDYTQDKDITYTAPKMVKIDDTRVMLIWNKKNVKTNKSVLQYTIVDENGTKLSEIKTIEKMKIGDEEPIIYNNKVVWSRYRKGRLILNSIPLE